MKPWYRVLLAARRIGTEERLENGRKVIIAVPFTADKLAKEAGLKDTSKCPAAHVASAWLGKFVRWGYVIKEGSKEERPRGRWPSRYLLTKWGIRFRLRAEKPS